MVSLYLPSISKLHHGERLTVTNGISNSISIRIASIIFPTSVPLNTDTEETSHILM